MNLDLKDVKRIFILGDIHFGVRASSMQWFEISKSYFEDFFIPLLEREYREGDILIQLGDVFENRQIVNLKINSYVIELFERLGKILPIYCIAGNHDIYYKRTNEITSLDALRFIPNINIVKENTMLTFGETKCFLMPWQSSTKQEVKSLEAHSDAEYVFCHSEMEGVLLNRQVRHEKGVSVKKFKNFKTVYSGHIHFSQIRGNIHMVGNAYQMTRSDMDNLKSVYLLDLSTGEHEIFENTISPKFKKLNINNLMELPFGEFQDAVKNNFVDLYIPSSYMLKYNIARLNELVIKDVKEINPIVYDERTFIDVDKIDDVELDKNFDVFNLAKDWLKNKKLDKELNDKILHKLNQLHTKSVMSYDIDL